VLWFPCSPVPMAAEVKDKTLPRLPLVLLPRYARRDDEQCAALLPTRYLCPQIRPLGADAEKLRTTCSHTSCRTRPRCLCRIPRFRSSADRWFQFQFLAKGACG